MNQMFRLEKEPIFASILHTMVLGNALNLKKKARIRIKNACVLIGVVDELGILKEGEIFVQIERNSFEKDEGSERVEKEATGKKKLMAMALGELHPQIISGDVIVTKNPCSHPGDIRLLKAIESNDPRVKEF